MEDPGTVCRLVIEIRPKGDWICSCETPGCSREDLQNFLLELSNRYRLGLMTIIYKFPPYSRARVTEWEKRPWHEW